MKPRIFVIKRKKTRNRLDIKLGILSMECSHIKHWSWKVGSGTGLELHGRSSQFSKTEKNVASAKGAKVYFQAIRSEPGSGDEIPVTQITRS